MKVCLIVSDFSPKVGGIATFNNHLAAGLARSPDVEHVLVIALQGKERAVEEISSKLTVHRMPMGNIWQTAVTLRKELASARSCDVFHAPNVFPLCFLTVIIGKFMLHKPVISTFFGTDVLANLGSVWTRLAKGFTLRRATITTAFSYSTRSLAAARYHIPEDFFPVISYPFPPHTNNKVEDIRHQYGYAEDDVIVLTVSNLVKRKGTEDLVHALSLVPNPKIKLCIVGDGPERANLEKLIQKLGLHSRVQLTGRVPDVDSFYHHADIFVLASYYFKEEGDVEGLGIVFLEAEQHGLPVIGTRSGGIPEALVEGESGLLVEERNIPALAKAIETLAMNPQMRHQMGEKGKSFVAKRFDVAHVVGEYVAVYRKAMGLV